MHSETQSDATSRHQTPSVAPVCLIGLHGVVPRNDRRAHGRIRGRDCLSHRRLRGRRPGGRFIGLRLCCGKLQLKLLQLQLGLRFRLRLDLHPRLRTFVRRVGRSLEARLQVGDPLACLRLMREAISTHSETQSDALRDAIRCTQRRNQMKLVAIRRHQTPSEPIRRTQMHASTLSRATVSSDWARCSSA